MKNGPCKDCPERRLGCHADCKDYLKWKAEHEAELEAWRIEKATTPRPTEDTKKLRWRWLKPWR